MDYPSSNFSKSCWFTYVPIEKNYFNKNVGGGTRKYDVVDSQIL